MILRNPDIVAEGYSGPRASGDDPILRGYVGEIPEWTPRERG